MARVSLTTGNMRQYLGPIEAAQVVPLLQDSTLMCTISRRFAVSFSAVSRAGGFQGTGCRRSLTHQQHRDQLNFGKNNFFTLTFRVSLNLALCRLITSMSITQYAILSFLTYYPVHINIDPHDFFLDVFSKCF